MYAVNIADLAQDQPNSRIPALLIAPVRGTVEAVTKNLDGYALTLDCSDDQAEAIIRLVKRFSAVRCYRWLRKGVWHEL